MFMICLNPQLKKKIIFGDIVPKKIEDWYAKAIKYDSNYCLAQAMMGLDNQTPKKNTGRSWFNQNQNQNKDPNAMDIGATTTTTRTAFIGALTEEMQAALMKIGACFRCRKMGHLSRNCLLKNQGQQQQQQRTNTPKDIQRNIQNMTKEEKAELLALIVKEEDF